MTIRPKLWLTTSLIVMALSLTSIVIIGPVWGIDFTGGSLLEITSDRADSEAVRELLNERLELATTVQVGERNTLLIKSEPLSEDQHQELLTILEEGGILVEELRFESIGPTIGEELRRKALVAVSIVVTVLIIYLAYTFRQATALLAPWKFGVAAVYALVHDLLFVTALFVLLGRWYGAPIDTLFVTAMLALLGYSVNDTIVIFNRLRLEYSTRRGASLLELIEAAVQGSLIRSLNTSLTTLLVLGALLLFGGSTIRWFVVALAAGTIVGTYSSLLVASPLLYYLARRR